MEVQGFSRWLLLAAWHEHESVACSGHELQQCMPKVLWNWAQLIAANEVGVFGDDTYPSSIPES